MKIFVAADHAGFEMKEKILEELVSQGYDTVNLGTDSLESVDYPDYARKLARRLQREEGSRGVLICGSGIGISIAANRYKRIRAFVCHSGDEARRARQHNDGNVICFGARVLEWPMIKECLDIFLKTEFESGGRHERRVHKMDDCEDCD